MRAFLAALVVMSCSTTLAQDAVEPEGLIEGLNKRIQQSQPKPGQPEFIAPQTGTMHLNTDELPNWGVVVRNNSGDVVEVFGQVNYEVTNTGEVEVPGYHAPVGAKLEVVPQTEWLKTIQTASQISLDPMFQPISAIPGAVTTATDYLANELCGRKGRPSGLTLSLVVSASGSVFFASAGTEAGSEVAWDFRDVCTRYGLEGDGIPFR